MLSRCWKKPSLEAQVVKIVKENPKIKEEILVDNELVIEEKEITEKPQKKAKTQKKTATNIHLEIKQILEDNSSLSGHQKARSVLKKAFKKGFSGKRLQKWKSYLDKYFLECEKTVLLESAKESTITKLKEKKKQ